MSSRAAIRVGVDKSLGSDGYPGTPALKGSRNLGVNRLPLVRVGDKYAPHGQHPTRFAGGGSRTVMANRVPLHRNGDPITCGDKAFGGSRNVGSR